MNKEEILINQTKAFAIKLEEMSKKTKQHHKDIAELTVKASEMLNEVKTLIDAQKAYNEAVISLKKDVEELKKKAHIHKSTL